MSLKATLLDKIKSVIRTKPTDHEQVNVLDFPSSFAEIRDYKNPSNTEKSSQTTIYESIPVKFSPSDDALSDSGESLHKRDVPKNLTKEQRKHISAYTDNASKKINRFLRNKAGLISRPVSNKEIETVPTAIKMLSSAFEDKENTNREPITLYTGIPPGVAESFKVAGKKSIHLLPAFTSTSSHNAIAEGFGKSYTGAPYSSNEFHTMRISAPEHTAMSIKEHSFIPAENEYLLNHGQHIEYHGTTKHKTLDGNIHYVHHVSLIPGKNKKLEEYGEYSKDRENYEQ